MGKIKKFLYRLKDETGEVLLLLTVATLVVAAVGTHAVRVYAEEKKEEVQSGYTTIQNLDAPGDDTDANKVWQKLQEDKLDAAVKLGEYAVGTSVPDDAGILGLTQKTGMYDVAKKDEEKQEDSDSSEDDDIFTQGLMGAVAGGAGNLSIEEKLDENNLPSSEITQDIVKVVANVTSQLGTPDTEAEEIVDISVDAVKDALTNKEDDGKIDEDSSGFLDTVKEKLSEKNKLEDEITINKRKEYNLSVLEREELEKDIELYKHYKDEGSIIISDLKYIKIQERLEHLNEKISALEEELQENSEKAGEDSADEETATEEEVSEELAEDAVKAPTIKLKIIAGPTYSEADGVCYYRVKAVVTGDPSPTVTFSKDNSGGAWGSTTVQINLRDGGSYTLTATATNSEGSASDSIYLPWGCAVEDDESTQTDGGGSSSGGGSQCPYGSK
jgi:hypothetical protein